MKQIFMRCLAAVLAAAVIMVFSPGGSVRADNTGQATLISFSRVASLNVYVDGLISGDLSRDNIVCGEIITLTAPSVAGKTFSHWAFGSEAGPVAGTRNTYRFALNSDTKLYAVYDAGADNTEPSVVFSSVIKEEYNGIDYIRLTATYSLPQSVADPAPAASNPVLGETGIRYTTNCKLGVADNLRDLLTDPVEGINVESLLKSDKKKGLYISSDEFYYAMGDWTLGIKNPGGGIHVYAVAYVTRNGETVFSDVKDIVFEDLENGYRMSSNIGEVFDFPDD